MAGKITVKYPGGEAVIEAADGKSLADVLCENGFTVPAACARLGKCGKCRVKLISGSVLDEAPDKNGSIRSCRARVCGDAVIYADFPDGKTKGFSENTEYEKSRCGIAVDIGTTTVAAAFLKNGTVSYASRLNPQSAYGADVIGRIEACSKGFLNLLSRLIRDCISGLIRELDPGREAKELVISGNTVMLHIFCGISPEGMGFSPFTPEFTGSVTASGEKFGLDIEKVTVLPSVSAFIGSDITAGIYVLGLHETDKCLFLADLGTNGELVISDRGRILCTSTAAGPAFEGACIECGTGGIDGAIDRVYREDGSIKYTTVGGAKPVGICGAGLTDAAALMLKEKLIDESGYLKNKFYICENVYITPEDVRQFQLAKSAIYSGISVLTDEIGKSFDGIDEFYIAGGLGYYINPENAMVSGILPDVPPEKVKPAGNTSLAGAVMCIGSDEAVEKMRKIAESCRVIDLGGNPDFSQKFIDNINFNTDSF